jgi:hypothetical protein
MPPTAIARAPKARENVASMTSCNLYPHGLERRVPQGTELIEPASKFARIGLYGTLSSAFRHRRPLKRALLTAQVQNTNNSGFSRAAQMITYNPAGNALMQNTNTARCNADLVILDAPDFTEGHFVAKRSCMSLNRKSLPEKDGNRRKGATMTFDLIYPSPTSITEWPLDTGKGHRDQRRHDCEIRENLNRDPPPR